MLNEEYVPVKRILPHYFAYLNGQPLRELGGNIGEEIRHVEDNQRWQF